jgi:hypothetical protein
MSALALSYVVPVRVDAPEHALTAYLEWVSAHVDVVVVDGSDARVFAAHHECWGAHVRHLPVDPARVTPNGKVGGVLTGLAECRFDRVVIADDDVRYDLPSLERIARLLDEAEVVRPQNVFTEWPWHAWWDTGRTLLARVTGGDWPGTLGVRRDFLLALGGYDGDVMFENLELVRTVVAGGGRERPALDLVVGRVPPPAAQFRGQRVRQAYDELARPGRLAVELALLPVLLAGGRRFAARTALAAVLAAEVGRRRAHGARAYPPATVLAAPLWICERAVTSWIAVAQHVLAGGVAYRGTRISRAASRPAQLRARLRERAPVRRAQALPGVRDSREELGG